VVDAQVAVQPKAPASFGEQFGVAPLQARAQDPQLGLAERMLWQPAPASLQSA
jgi:hypothetical protein